MFNRKLGNILWWMFTIAVAGVWVYTMDPIKRPWALASFFAALAFLYWLDSRYWFKCARTKMSVADLFYCQAFGFIVEQPYHGCLTGDCPHNEKRQCVACLLKDFHELNGYMEKQPQEPI